MDETTINAILDVATELLRSSGEVYRTEEALIRMTRAYGGVRAHVFVIHSCIILTVVGADGTSRIKMRRISGHMVNLDRLDRLNDLTRKICATQPSPRSIRSALVAIDTQRPYPFRVRCLLYFVIAGAFSLFFGGTFVDAVISGVLGICLMTTLKLCERFGVNNIFATIVCSYFVGLLTVFAMHMGLGKKPDTIMIGNIMLIIPGLVFTNGIRDMLGGDPVSGLMRLIEAGLVAVAVSAGFAFATRFGWGLI